MKEDDVRLQFLNHPLYTLEYPSLFKLIDLNNIPDHPMKYGVSDVDFTLINYDTGSLIAALSIRVRAPGLNYFYNANEKFDDLLKTKTEVTDNVTVNEELVSGITAHYLESLETVEDTIVAGVLIDPKHQMSLRAVVFDYADLIWIISLAWSYQDSEPPEVEEYFNHVIETFRILD
jgi:hypothetical protein